MVRPELGQDAHRQSYVHARYIKYYTQSHRPGLKRRKLRSTSIFRFSRLNEAEEHTYAHSHEGICLVLAVFSRLRIGGHISSKTGVTIRRSQSGRFQVRFRCIVIEAAGLKGGRRASRTTQHTQAKQCCAPHPTHTRPQQDRSGSLPLPGRSVSPAPPPLRAPRCRGGLTALVPTVLRPSSRRSARSACLHHLRLLRSQRFRHQYTEYKVQSDKKEDIITNKRLEEKPYLKTLHRSASLMSDKVALGLVKALRIPADLFFAKKYGHRAIVLETVGTRRSIEVEFSQLTPHRSGSARYGWWSVPSPSLAPSHVPRRCVSPPLCRKHANQLHRRLDSRAPRRGGE